jgi:acetyltransferase-like isoleucine patch superfamily enzyme
MPTHPSFFDICTPPEDEFGRAIWDGRGGYDSGGRCSCHSNLLGGQLMPIDPSTKLGRDVRIFRPELVNIYGATIGDDTRVGPFVEIQRGAIIGARCKIQSHSFIPEGVEIEDEVFVGHNVVFTNDLWPRAVDDEGRLIIDDWKLSRTLVKRRAVIGSSAVVLPVTVGEGAFVGAGAVVTKDIPDFAIAVGNPARIVGDMRMKRPDRSRLSGSAHS